MQKNICRIAFFLLFNTAIFSGTTQAQIASNFLSNDSIQVFYNNKPRLSGRIARIHSDGAHAQLQKKNTDNILLLSIHYNLAQQFRDTDSIGILFSDIPKYKRGVAIWRYKPWNSWSKPVALSAPAEMPDWDVQFFYWQYEDGTFGAAVPLSGNGFRTTLGSTGKNWGSKAMAYSEQKQVTDIPSVAVGFGADPYVLFSQLYDAALNYMQRGNNERKLKQLPEPFQYIGWCTWNSSGEGKYLNENFIRTSLLSFSDSSFKLGWLLIDDGWFRQHEQRLQSFEPDASKFPHGFKPLIEDLKKQNLIRYAGIWHAFNGYWGGIDSSSQLGQRFQKELFSWDETRDGKTVTYHFIKPTSDSLKSFYSSWHSYLKQEGFDFIKVDNQLVAERMAKHNYPIFTLADSMHRALYYSADKYFSGDVINCMDMTADAYLNFGHSAVARAVEDYFPYHSDETYNLQHGNAAAHVLQAVYNSLYFSQMVYPDFDMFQSHNPNAEMHAIARALNNGPIYICDNPGEQHFDILRKLVFSDGHIAHAQTSLLPSADCLFQVQDTKLFKAYSRCGRAGLLAALNLADTNAVRGTISVNDVHGLSGEKFAVYEHFSGNLTLMSRQDVIPVNLSRMGYQLYYVIPLRNDFAAFGLTEKYNAPSSLLDVIWKNDKTVLVRLYEGGLFKAYSARKPLRILLNEKPIAFDYQSQIISISIPVQQQPVLQIEW